MPGIKATIGVVILLGILVVGGLLATETWNPSWNPFKPSAERVVEESIENLFSLKTLKYEVGLEVEAMGLEPTDLEDLAGLGGSGQMSVKVEGALDAQDKENIKGKADLDFVLTSGETTYSGGVELRGISQKTYFRIKSVPEIVYSFLAEDLVKTFENQWIEIDMEELQGAAGQEEALGQEQMEKFLTDLQDIIEREVFFEIKSDLGQEELGGETVQRYLVSVDKEAIKRALPLYVETAEQYLPEEEQALYQEEMDVFLEEFPQAIDELWAQAGGVELDVWIGANDNTLRKMQFIKEVSQEAGAVNILVYLQFFDFDKPVQIDQPADVKSIEDVLAPLMMGLIPSDFTMPETE